MSYKGFKISGSRKEIQVPIHGIDKIISYIAPKWGLSRLKARATMAWAETFSGASKTRSGTKNWKYNQGDPVIETIKDLPDLQDKSSDLYRNNPLAGGTINTGVNNVIGTGLKFNSVLNGKILGLSPEQAKEKEKEIERQFASWCEYCEISNKMKFADTQDLAFRQILEKGEALILFTSKKDVNRNINFRLQFIDIERLNNPEMESDSDTMISGIKFDKNTGRPEKYHIQNRHPANYTGIEKDTWIIIDAFQGKTGLPNILHLFHVKFPGQMRGIPILAPVMEKLKQLDRYIDAETMRKVIQGMFTVFIETDEGEAPLPGQASDIGDTTSTGSNGTDTETHLDYGLIMDLKKGERVQMADPGKTDQAFESFFLSSIKMICSVTGIPYEILLKTFNDSYSASRASLLEAWRFFKIWRHWLSRHYCQEVFKRFMWESVSNGIIKAPGFFINSEIQNAYLGSQWIGDGMGQIDPLKEALAIQKRLEILISSRSEESAELGKNFDVTMDQIEKEQPQVSRIAQAVGIPINITLGGD